MHAFRFFFSVVPWSYRLRGPLVSIPRPKILEKIKQKPKCNPMTRTRNPFLSGYIQHKSCAKKQEILSKKNPKFWVKEPRHEKKKKCQQKVYLIYRAMRQCYGRLVVLRCSPAPPPPIFLNEIAGSETGSRLYLLKRDAPCHPDVIFR